MKARRHASPKLDEIEDLDLAASVYENNLETLAAAVERMPGTRLVLLTHPAIWKGQTTDAEERTLWAGYTCMDCAKPRYYSTAALRDGLALFNRTLLDVCTRHGLACLDLEARIDKTLDHFHDDAHLTATGAGKVAAEVADFLLERGILGP